MELPEEVFEACNKHEIWPAILGMREWSIPVGYYRKDGYLYPSEDKEAVQFGFAAYRTGQHSFMTTARLLNDHGYTIPDVRNGGRKLWTKDAVDEMLRNPVYIGKDQSQGCGV